MADDKSLYNRFISMEHLEQIAKELAPEIDINYYAHATPEEIAAKFHVACLEQGGIAAEIRKQDNNLKPIQL